MDYSLEFCPASQALDVFVCGTYKLDDDAFSSDLQRAGPQRRRGQCLVFQVDYDSVDDIAFKKIQEVDLPAVLDMKWCPVTQDTSPLLAIADSEGNISLYELQLPQRQLHRLATISCASPDTLCLSLDWSNRRSPHSAPGSLIVSLSNGGLCLLRPDTTSGFTIAEKWHAHDHEPWAAAWNYWDTNIIYSGGDDLKLKTWDLRQGLATPVYTNKRFDAGVTSIQSHPHIEHLLAVGSYDNTVQLFDARKPLAPLSMANVGGGAWRVKWHPSARRKSDVLVASMHDGFKVVRFDLDPTGIPSKDDGVIIKRFDEHSSLAYGVDWSYGLPLSERRDTIIGSCSFYDHTLHLWWG